MTLIALFYYNGDQRNQIASHITSRYLLTSEVKSYKNGYNLSYQPGQQDSKIQWTKGRNPTGGIC